ncbi:hypothetical protein DMB65_09350 [Flavobacterium cheongpyeongense]|jgi:hypothetical protein|uniref:Fibronectin type-III domain-containing protein n=1 Tax=Flavobacterium cheongpyeongense TaxID=2212651 RepID=A0A2V4BTV5_9FLAO|nr:hypothetical protein [Flavobacterium cheongpyeongense]PXY41150.1 hypothetical protein DMB65_09350 [Flavobacterium cheongpyeongense]
MKTINKLLLIALSILTYSCDDILEEDISDNTVQLISPTENTTIESNVVNFKWSSLKGADKYRIQIYEDEILLLDSLTASTNLTLPLETGSYSWSVRGENYAYESLYSSNSNFSTVIPDDLTNQKVVLSSPENNKFFNHINIPLVWELLANATTYNLKIVNATTGLEVYAKPDLTVKSLTLDLTSLEEGSYEWQLTAKNDESETKKYASRKFNIDTTIPNQPKNTSPTDDFKQTSNLNITFTWSIATDIGISKSPVSYIVEFANDSDFNTNVQTQNSNSTTLQKTFTATGIYYWRVRAIDGAGNVGTNSAAFKFTLN